MLQNNLFLKSAFITFVLPKKERKFSTIHYSKNSVPFGETVNLTNLTLKELVFCCNSSRDKMMGQCNKTFQHQHWSRGKWASIFLFLSTILLPAHQMKPQVRLIWLKRNKFFLWRFRRDSHTLMLLNFLFSLSKAWKISYCFCP